mmetsp:Transcript_49499/g.159846  ORF Transcript_49499/g.159846 Transcript_49499/m.159846 type:complete len:218 (-) Transcript_49499:484-1137(-)
MVLHLHDSRLVRANPIPACRVLQLPAVLMAHVRDDASGVNLGPIVEDARLFHEGIGNGPRQQHLPFVHLLDDKLERGWVARLARLVHERPGAVPLWILVRLALERHHALRVRRDLRASQLRKVIAARNRKADLPHGAVEVQGDVAGAADRFRARGADVLPPAVLAGERDLASRVDGAVVEDALLAVLVALSRRAEHDRPFLPFHVRELLSECWAAVA